MGQTFSTEVDDDVTEPVGSGAAAIEPVDPGAASEPAPLDSSPGGDSSSVHMSTPAVADFVPGGSELDASQRAALESHMEWATRYRPAMAQGVCRIGDRSVIVVWTDMETNVPRSALVRTASSNDVAALSTALDCDCGIPPSECTTVGDVLNGHSLRETFVDALVKGQSVVEGGDIRELTGVLQRRDSP